MQYGRGFKNIRRPGPRPVPGVMNKLEQKRADYLEALKIAGRIVDYVFEPFSIKLGKNLHYKPDFLVVYPGHFEIEETKGFWQDDARVKIKAAAAKFPWIAFKGVQWKKKQWIIEEF